MRAFALLLSLFIGIGLGVWATRFVITRWVEVFGVHHGVWYFPSKIGALELDPYLRAWLFGREELPLAEGEGFSLHAERDSDGHNLQANCSYRLEGMLPHARYWTFIVVDKKSRRILNPSKRAGFSSFELGYIQGKPISIIISPEFQPGYWIPLTGEEEIVVVFRFYEIPLSASATKLNAAQLPNLTRIGCAP